MSIPRRTFSDLFKDADFSTVEIPLIQRDYAQGRKTTVAREVRIQFLDALYEKLSLAPDSPELPLDLDFVYGSLDKTARVFCPLDGQQRLTTLFLLHWYLACLDGRADAFKGFIRTERHSRFTYKVRPSSTEFCDALTDATVAFSALLPSDDVDKCSGAGNELSKTISDAPWFLLSWLQDPTVRSALEMLDAIHARFKDSHGYYDRLVATDHPYVTFQFLELNEFKLSDELYIKMNARGKPLTAFEAFKARLEQLIGLKLNNETRVLNGKTVRLREYFSHRIDTEWADLFWHYRDVNTALFDHKFMNFVRGLALVLYPHGRETESNADVNKTLNALLKFNEDFTFFQYQQDNCLNDAFLKGLVILLDRLSGNKEGIKTYLLDAAYFDEEATFRKVLASKLRDPTYSEWIQFYAYSAYHIKYQSGGSSAEFYEWMRVTSNLALNSIYNRVDEFKESLIMVQCLLDETEGKPILEIFADSERPVSSFNRQQVREERLKAQLMRRSTEWRALILAAEKHGYFRGQIEFLLKFSGVLDRWIDKGVCDWSDAEDEAYRLTFAAYYEKAIAIFDNDGLKPFNNFLWERALLTVGNYLLPAGPNFSFLDNQSRDASWKRLLRSSDQANDGADNKRAMVQKLLDQVDSRNVQESLKKVIDTFLQTPATSRDDEWIRKIVECPAAIGFCRERRIRMITKECIYLLSKSRMHCKHADLFTYHFKVCVLDSKVGRGELSPFTGVEYHAVSTDDDNERPYASVRCAAKNISLTISYHDGMYRLNVRSIDSIWSEKLTATLVDQLKPTQGSNRNCRFENVRPDQVVALVERIVLALRSLKCDDEQANELAFNSN